MTQIYKLEIFFVIAIFAFALSKPFETFSSNPVVFIFNATCFSSHVLFLLTFFLLPSSIFTLHECDSICRI